MNTHDKYELPPLPPLYIAPSVEPVDYPNVAQALMDYARAAIEPYAKRISELESQLEAIGAGGVTQGQRLIEADRKRRSGPVACFKCGHSEHGGECVNVVPQPAEPVKVLSDADILDLWTGDPTHSRPVMGKNKVIAFARALLARYTKEEE